MKRIIKYDFYNENFETYFNERVDKMNGDQRAMLPDEIKYKLIRFRGKFQNGLTFQEKVFILNTCFGARVMLYVYDDDQHIQKEDIQSLKQAQRGEIQNKVLFQETRIQAGFIMADKNLFQTMMYLNHLYTSDIYRLFKTINLGRVQAKGKEFAKGKEIVTGICDIILKYEQRKKSLVMSYGLTPQRLYVLFYFSTGEKFGKDFCNRDFQFAYNQSARMLSGAVKYMTDTGYLLRRGDAAHYRYTLTAKGTALLNKIINRLLDYYYE